MTKPNTLLKVVSILYIIISALGLVAAVVAAVMGGAVLGSLAESASFGIAAGSAMIAVLAGRSVLSLVAGILGVKGQFTGCKVLGVILLVLAAVNAVMSISMSDGVGDTIVSVVAVLVLPVLYVWGAFKGPKE